MRRKSSNGLGGELNGHSLSCVAYPFQLDLCLLLQLKQWDIKLSKQKNKNKQINLQTKNDKVSSNFVREKREKVFVFICKKWTLLSKVTKMFLWNIYGNHHKLFAKNNKNYSLSYIHTLLTTEQSPCNSSWPTHTWTKCQDNSWLTKVIEIWQSFFLTLSLGAHVQNRTKLVYFILKPYGALNFFNSFIV